VVDLYHTFTVKLLDQDNTETPSSNSTPSLYQNPYRQIYTMDKGLSSEKLADNKFEGGKDPHPKFADCSTGKFAH